MMYILLREHNDYNQYGDYFCAAFINKPSVEELMHIINESEEYCLQILNGIERKNGEDIWYKLTEYNEGEVY